MTNLIYQQALQALRPAFSAPERVTVLTLALQFPSPRHLDDEVTITYYQGNKRDDETRKKYERLTTHVGRRTFICNALSMVIPTEGVMKWTGYSDYKAMKPYVDVADRIKAEAMSKFDEK